MDEASLERRRAGRGDCGRGARVGADAADTHDTGRPACRPGGEFACRPGGEFACRPGGESACRLATGGRSTSGDSITAGGVAACCRRPECGPVSLGQGPAGETAAEAPDDALREP
jgi:hypothetical protein